MAQPPDTGQAGPNRSRRVQNYLVPGKKAVSAVLKEKVARRVTTLEDTPHIPRHAREKLDRSETVNALQNYVIDSVQHRMRYLGNPDITIPRHYLHWCLPRNENLKAIWVKIFENSMFVNLA